MTATITISRKFTFEAAHSLDLPDGTDEGYRRLHGHSFTGQLSVRGLKSDINDWLLDFGSFDPVIAKIRAQLDHAYLNDVEGLHSATLENLCMYIADLIKDDLPDLYIVELGRETCGQRCVLTLG